MKLTEQSTVAEHLKALAESEKKFHFYEEIELEGMPAEIMWNISGDKSITQWRTIMLDIPPSQDDWDSILKEIGWEYEIGRKIGFGWFFIIRSNPAVTVESPPGYPSKSLAASAAGCAAIREYLTGKP